MMFVPGVKDAPDADVLQKPTRLQRFCSSFTPHRIQLNRHLEQAPIVDVNLVEKYEMAAAPTPRPTYRSIEGQRG
jgi:hypothetical protein